MPQVKTPAEALKIITESFKGSISATEILPLHACLGRVLAEDICSSEDVPGYTRSTVDGYAVKAADTFSSSAEAILVFCGVVNTGEGADFEISDGECAYVPTGGAVPRGADAVVMLEHAESRGGGKIAVLNPVSACANLVSVGQDVFNGKTVLKRGRIIHSEDIGALAALGICDLKLVKKPVVGILSAGNELVPLNAVPSDGQIRDANSAMLAASVQSFGAEAKCYGIVRDGYVNLRNKLNSALRECDIVLICGGSSVGQMDSTCAVIGEHGQILIHGIAMKPGKPTIVGSIDGKAVFALPGHPLAADFAAKLFLKPLIDQLLGCKTRRLAVKAVLTENVASSRGHDRCVGTLLSEKDGITYAEPIDIKSGYVSSLAGCDGYFVISGNCASYKKGAEIDVFI